MGANPPPVQVSHLTT